MGPGMSPDATESSTFGRPVTRALSQDVQEALEAAEDRGFEPRRAARPNRISSPFGFPDVASKRVSLTDVAQVSALRGARRSNLSQPAATCVVPFLCHPTGLPCR